MVRFTDVETKRKGALMSGAFEQKDNTGVAFPESEKKSDQHPDLTGNATIKGERLRVAIWKKESKAGKPYLSIAFSEFQTKQNQPNGGGDSESFDF